MKTSNGKVDWIVVSGLVLSVLIPVVLVLGGWGNPAEGIAIGLIGAVFTLAFELRSIFISISELEPVRTLKAADRHILLEYARRIKKIEADYAGTLVENELKAKCRKLTDHLTRLSEGEISSTGQYHYLERGIEAAVAAGCTEMKAVTFIGANDRFWTGSVSKKYMQANIDAHNKGVEITRLMVFEDINNLPQNLDRVIAAHEQTGATVKLVNAANLDGSQIVNLVVWLIKGEPYAGWTASSNAKGEQFQSSLFYNPNALQRLHLLFNNISEKTERSPKDHWDFDSVRNAFDTTYEIEGTNKEPVL